MFPDFGLTVLEFGSVADGSGAHNGLLREFWVTA
jgi:hypothetical protein